MEHKNPFARLGSHITRIWSDEPTTVDSGRVMPDGRVLYDAVTILKSDKARSLFAELDQMKDLIQKDNGHPNKS
jgi:hypothetical protein